MGLHKLPPFIFLFFFILWKCFAPHLLVWKFINKCLGWNHLVLGRDRRGIPGWFRGRRAGSGTPEVVLVPPKCWLFQEFLGSFLGVLCPCFHKHPALPRAHPRKNIPRSERKIFGETFFLKTRGKCEILPEVPGTGAGDASPACAASGIQDPAPGELRAGNWGFAGAHQCCLLPGSSRALLRVG